ncbi:horcolin-like [Curcuma longa]|uniref:horcolin-like n=1 Tax=Curcuma longa TaxID=136217 RepID=UPI003D9F50E3
MAFAHFNLNLDVNKCFGGLWKSCRRPKSDVEKLNKEMQKLKAKRNAIKSKIDEARRGSKLTTAEAKQWQRDLDSLEDQVAAIFDDFKRISGFYNNTIIKIGAWGGSGGNKFDVGRSASQITKIRLQAGRVVDHLEVSYLDDRNKFATCSAGGKGGQFHEFKLGSGEYINWMVGSVCEFDDETCISQLEFKTNFGKQHGPFGRIDGGRRFSVPVMDGGRIVGFFGQFTKYVNEIGVYLAPN